MSNNDTAADQLLAALQQPAPAAPSIEAAHEMGAKGAPPSEGERLAFEAWMRGHEFALCASWDDRTKHYRGTDEHGGTWNENAMRTRLMWAAWRDRAALVSAAKQAPLTAGNWDEVLDAYIHRLCARPQGHPGQMMPGDPGPASDLHAELAALRQQEPAGWLYTLEYGASIADTRVSVDKLRYPFGVCGADYARANDDGVSLVRECPLYAFQVDKTKPAQGPAYAYSIDGGETYHGAEQTPEAALGFAHDELATEHEPGTTHTVHVARLVPGVEILRGLPHSVRYLAESAIGTLEEALYDEIGGDEQLIDDLTPEQRQSIGRAILEIIAATGAIRGQGLADDTQHTVTVGTD